MIKTKNDYKLYILADEFARFGKKVPLTKKILCGNVWRFNVLLRKMEYNMNCRKGVVKKFFHLIYKLKMHRLSVNLGWQIAPNCFGPGLCVVHRGPVIVNGKVRFGANCRIQAMVNIGSDSSGAPTAGNNIYIGPGAKIFGGITLKDKVAIGANAVVNKSFDESNITIAGVPAKIVSRNSERVQIVEAVSLAKKYLGEK